LADRLERDEFGDVARAADARGDDAELAAVEAGAGAGAGEAGELVGVV
jgi:hypothetical protein